MNLKPKSYLAAVAFLLVLLLFSCINRCNISKDKDKLIDSLVQEAEDSLNVNASFSRKNLKRAMNLAPDSLNYYELKYKFASTYVAFSQYDTAALYGENILAFCRKSPKSARIFELKAMSYNIIGNYYAQICNSDSAIWCYGESLRNYAKTGKSEQFPNLYLNIADSYIRKGDFANGVYYNRKALLVSDSLHTIREMGFPIYFSLGQIYMELRDFSLSDSYFRLADKYYAERSIGEKYVYCNNRGNYFYYKEEYRRALLWFKKARRLVSSGDYKYYISLCDLNLADVYLNLGATDSAQICLNRCHDYFVMQQNQTALYYMATIRAGIALKQDNLEQARVFLRQSDNPSGIDPNIVSIRNKYMQDFYEKTGDYKRAYLYQSKNIAQDDSIRADRVKKRIAELDMRYKLDETLLRKNALIRQQSAEVKTLRLNRFLWILACVLALSVAVFLFLYMKRQRYLQWMKLFDQITRLRLQNIRNRLSPHFIFNTLNRELSTMEESQRNNLLVLVQLLRSSLEMTEQMSVTLAQELSFVKGYIQLEERTLRPDFQLQWIVDDQIRLDQILVPPMIVQIPVENAIKHALRPKNGLKCLSVSVAMKDDGVGIVVRDNGAGYDPFKPVETKGTGTGMKVLMQTIQLLNSKNSRKISFRMLNISQEGNTGASAEIFIPNEYKFDL